jgi:hypothetical protein
MNSSVANIAALAARISGLEAESAVRLVLRRYMALCDVPCQADRLPALAQLLSTA